VLVSNYFTKEMMITTCHNLCPKSEA